MNAKRAVSEEENERHKKVLSQLIKLEGNRHCADCTTRNPTWASVNLGVFVCLTCSGIHRSLGVHISQVRSCNLDTWLPRQVEFMRIMGNVKGNSYWEAKLPSHFKRPPSGSPNPELAAFIRSKYVDRKYAAGDAPPPNIDNWPTHPYACAAAAGGGEAAAAAAVAGAAPGAAAAAVAPAAKQQQAQVQQVGGLIGVGVAPAAAAAAGYDEDEWNDFVSADPVEVSGSASDPFANLVGHNVISSMSKVAVQ